MVLWLLLITAGVVLLLAGRHLTFFFDEWSWILERRGGGIGTFVDPYNGHFSLFPVAVYKVLLALVGLRHYIVYRVVGIALHLLCAALLYVLVRRRLGPWLALAPTALLLFMGTAFQDLIWPFQIGFFASTAGGLGALALIEDRRSDPLAAALLVWAVISGGIGIPFLVACFVALVARADWSRLWIVGVPALVFVIWYLAWGSSETITLDALLAAPQYVANAAAGASAGIAGFGSNWGPPLAVGALIALSLCWRGRSATAPTPMLLAAIAGMLSFWGLAAIVRNGGPDPAASRYLYIGAVFIWLIVAESRLGSTLSGGWLSLAGVLAVGALIANLGVLRANVTGLREHDDNVRASLTAVEVAAPVVQPGFFPDKPEAPPISAGPYLIAVRDLGSPAFTLAELQRAPLGLRARADGVLEHAERLTAVPTSPPAGCRPLASSSPTAIQLAARPGRTVVIRDSGASRVSVYVRRFDGVFGPPALAVLPPHSTSAMHFPVDRAPGIPWQLQLVPGRAIAVCVR